MVKQCQHSDCDRVATKCCRAFQTDAVKLGCRKHFCEPHFEAHKPDYHVAALCLQCGAPAGDFATRNAPRLVARYGGWKAEWYFCSAACFDLATTARCDKCHENKPIKSQCNACYKVRCKDCPKCTLKDHPEFVVSKVVEGCNPQ